MRVIVDLRLNVDLVLSFFIVDSMDNITSISIVFKQIKQY